MLLEVPAAAIWPPGTTCPWCHSALYPASCIASTVMAAGLVPAFQWLGFFAFVFVFLFGGLGTSELNKTQERHLAVYIGATLFPKS